MPKASTPTRPARQQTVTQPPTVFNRLYAQLNAEQRRAIDTIEGVVMVLAGPGSGKTQVLAMRIAKILLETQMDPYNILCLTFTESGVAAMRKRLISIIGSAAYYVRIHTFHSFCNEVIQEHPEKFTFARELAVLSDVERVELFREIIDELPGTSPLKPFGNPYLFLPDIVSNIAAMKAEHITREQYEALLITISKLVTAATRPVDTFLAKKAGERSAADVNTVHTKLLKLRPRFVPLAAQFDRLEKIYGRFQDASNTAENKREGGKAVTKYRSDLARWFDRLKNRLPKQQALATVYGHYQEKLRRRGRYDYADMILFVVEAFKRDEALLARYQEQFQYILVDEYQDTNGAQNEAVHLLGQFHDNPNIFVVGDDKQSIYRFQGASLENLLFLYERYRQHVQVIVLTENYRSQQTILDAASALIAHNHESIERYIAASTPTLRAVRAVSTAPLRVTRFDTVDTETYGVARQVEQLLSQGIPPREIAVLYRRNADAAAFVEMMLKLKIPVQLEHGTNILDDIIIRQLLTLLRYLADPASAPLLWQILQYAFWRLPPLDVLKVQMHARTAKLELLTVLGDATHLQSSGVLHAAPFLALAQKVADWQAVAANRSLPDFIAHVVSESGILRYSMSDAADHLDVLNCLQSFFNEVKNVSQRQHTLTLPELLAHFDLLREHHIELSAAPLQTKRDAVRLMTAHRAKGLEFAHVFIVRTQDRHWGNLREHSMVPLPQGLLHYDKVAGEENNEDERRLFYVALTRAKDMVHISYATHSLSGRELVPAIFLTEIPAAYLASHENAELEDEARRRLQAVTIQSTPPERDSRLQAYVLSLLERYTLSVTHLNNYLTCPRLFYYRNLLRVPSVKTKYMAFGTAIHGALHDFCVGQPHDTLPTPTQLTLRFTWHLQRELLTPAEYKDALELGTQVLRDYYTQYHANCSRDNLLEYNFHSHGVTVDTIPITGMIDKIEIVDRLGKAAHVVDYKTGNPDTKRAELRSGGAYHRQLVFYKLLCDRSPRFTYTVQHGEIDFVQKSPTKDAFVKKRFTLDAADTDQLVTTIREVWKEIQALAFLDPTFEKYCGECEYCLLHQQGELAV